MQYSINVAGVLLSISKLIGLCEKNVHFVVLIMMGSPLNHRVATFFTCQLFVD